MILLGLGCNLYVSSLIISKSCGFGDAESARLVFDGLRQRPTKALVWNSMIRGYLKNGLPGLALDVYEEMELVSECEPDKQTFHLAINACNELSEFELGCRVGDRARRRGFDSDLLIATELVGLYCKMGDFETARRVFDRMSVRDVVLWNAMISRYSIHNQIINANDQKMVHCYQQRVNFGPLPQLANQPTSQSNHQYDRCIFFMYLFFLKFTFSFLAINTSLHYPISSH